MICGHIHQAEIRKMESSEQKGSVIYLNSGDWVESLTALEYNDKKWTIFQYKPEDFIKDTDEEDKTDAEDLDAKLDVMSLLERFRQEPG